MTIAVAYRPDDYGRAAVLWAAAKAEANKEKLVLITVSEIDPEFDEPEEIDLSEFTERFDLEGIEYEVRRAASLSVSDVVIDQAVDSGADRLVIGIRKRTPVGKMLMGRVTQMILLDAPMPVIAVKP
ncbi:universal stress protein [Aeromicrobium sp. 636]|uniref:Universal stress protein n=1 Tax=Aeromicrobium senzhongii TaxID=2663859 RepID=A0A8I0EWU5_9ACTN|nr:MULTISPECIES: universal stress protein [Aeromicrobium]MBC9226796.1 universal stress protein [Aeromicrobium senzhongii]MCQ3998896.1 universal stress protein [Aeromicrobium sp. 636]MTB89320.1 universal stress protein [Aeromicrobium senzhongii]QNL93419.1 universal stress protein [Aeromicrobium senzhongii]